MGEPKPLIRNGGLFTKNKRISIRVSESDLQKIHSKAENANMTFTEYVTKACLNKQIFVITGLDEVIRQQKAIGKNLNQLTILCNMGKVTMANLSELTEEYVKTNAILSDILERKRWRE